MSDTQSNVVAEGHTVGEAVRKAAEILGVPAEQVRHKIDVSHFRNEDGRAIPVDTVKVICWAADPGETEGARLARIEEGAREAVARSTKSKSKKRK